MNRKLLVAFLIVLAVAPVSTLIAMGMLWSDAGSSTSNNMTTTLNANTGLTTTVSTMISPRAHQHYKIDLTVSIGNCVNPYGTSC